MRHDFGQKAKSSDANRLSNSIPASYTIYKDGTDYYGERNFPGGSDIIPNTDANTVIQAAINALPATGGTVFIKAATYALTDEIQMKSHVAIIGEGRDSTILKLNKGIYKNVIEAIGTAETHVTDVTVKKLTVDGNYTNNPQQGVPAGAEELDQNGVSFQYVDRGLIQDVYAYDNAWNGIQCYRSEYCIVDSCFVKKTGWHGIEFWDDMLHSVISNNVVEGCTAGDGVVIEYTGSYNCIAVGNAVYNCKYGLALYHPTGHCGLVGNTAYDCSEYGILIESAASCVVSGNTVYSGTVGAIGLFAKANCIRTVVSGNMFSTPIGMYLKVTEPMMVVGNSHTCLPGDDGCKIEGDGATVTGLILKNNRFEGYGTAGKHGIRLISNVDEAIIEGNIIVNYDQPVSIENANCDGNRVRYNRVDGCDTTISNSGTGTIIKMNDGGESTGQGLYQEYVNFQDPSGTFEAGDKVVVKETTGGTKRLYFYDGSAWNYIVTDG